MEVGSASAAETAAPQDASRQGDIAANQANQGESRSADGTSAIQPVGKPAVQPLPWANADTVSERGGYGRWPVLAAGSA